MPGSRRSSSDYAARVSARRGRAKKRGQPREYQGQPLRSEAQGGGPRDTRARNLLIEGVGLKLAGQTKKKADRHENRTI